MGAKPCILSGKDQQRESWEWGEDPGFDLQTIFREQLLPSETPASQLSLLQPSKRGWGVDCMLVSEP